MKTVGERIKFARLHPKTGVEKVTLQKIATEIGKTPQLVKKWQLNESVPKARDLLAVERLTGYSAKWLLTGVENSPDGGTLDILQQGGRPVAQIDLTDVGEYLSNADFVVKTKVMSTHKGGPRSFEVVIKDRANDPVMIPGDRVVIDPDREPDPEDFCLALYDGRYVVRKYLDRLDGAELEPANKAYATVRVSKDDIVGRVIEFTRQV